MNYTPKDFSQLLGVKGLSNQLLKNHFTLYEGYVANTNKVIDLLSVFVRDGKIATPEYAELKRRFGWEFNGMRLHELYFDNIVIDGKKISNTSLLGNKIIEDFGTFENWENDFKGTGAMRGIGWVILAFDADGNRLINVWINEHDVGHLAGAIPLLVLDVFEHAYMLDYGLKKSDYIGAFMSAVNWNIVEARFQ